MPRVVLLAVTAALGCASAFAVAACGEDRGGVSIEGGTTATAGATTAVTTP